MSQQNTVVVLGGLGFAGSRICHALVRAGYCVRVFDRAGVSHFRLAEIADKVSFVEGDYSDANSVLAALGDSEIAVNLVHTTVPVSSMADPAADIRDNIEATVGWLKRLNETRIRRLLYFSSGGTVYGAAARSGLIPETSECEPVCAYGISKLAIEKYMLMFCSAFKVRPIILRPSNLYGPNPQLGRPQGLIGLLIAKSLRGEPIDVIGDGCAVRDYIHVDDVASAVTCLLNYEGAERVFNVGSGQGHSINDIIALLKNCMTVPEPRHVPARGFDVASNVLDTSRLTTETSWRCAIPLGEGIVRVYHSMREAMKQ